jgi:hypothetical protein
VRRRGAGTGLAAARELLVRLLAMGPDVAEALDHATRLVPDDPEHGGHAMLKASLLVRIGDQEARAISTARSWPDGAAARVAQPGARGKDHRQPGGRDRGLSPPPRSIRDGEAWWSLANLKTVRLDKADIAAMRAALPHDAVGGDGPRTWRNCISLGKAFEDQSRDDPAAAESAFAHYARGNALRRSVLDYDPARTEAAVASHAALFTRAVPGGAGGLGCPAADPIFVVGLPRSGSTLVEQILASHSQIEARWNCPT